MRTLHDCHSKVGRLPTEARYFDVHLMKLTMMPRFVDQLPDYELDVENLVESVSTGAVVVCKEDLVGENILARAR